MFKPICAAVLALAVARAALAQDVNPAHLPSEADKAAPPVTDPSKVGPRPETRPDESQPSTLPAEMTSTGWSAADQLAFPIRFGGYFWDDTGFLGRVNAQSGQPNQSAAYMQGRFVLGGSYARQFGGLSAMARVELMGLVNELSHGQYEAHTLDAYLRIGESWWDFQIGRYLGWEVYYRGQGIELYTAEEAGAVGGPTLYLLDFARGLENELGQAAIHLFPAKWVSLELSSIYGQQNNQNNFAVRPVADFKLGRLEIVGGVEWLRVLPQTAADKVQSTNKGAAGRIQYAFPYVTIGGDISRARVDANDLNGLHDTAKSYDKTSFGGFADIDIGKSSIGLGAHYTVQKDVKGENDTQTQLFLSYLYHLPIQGLSAKVVYGFARAHVEDYDTQQQWENNMNSVRVRLLYEFH